MKRIRQDEVAQSKVKTTIKKLNPLEHGISTGEIKRQISKENYKEIYEVTKKHRNSLKTVRLVRAKSWKKC